MDTGFRFGHGVYVWARGLRLGTGFRSLGTGFKWGTGFRFGAVGCALKMAVRRAPFNVFSARARPAYLAQFNPD